jgi:TolB protein
VIVAERYSPQNNGNGQIVAVRIGDGRARVLTSGHQDAVPAVAPDGRHIVFERCIEATDCDLIGKINIWIMRADGSHAHPLTACDGSRCLGSFDPAFSPDGRFIAFAQDLLDANGVNFNGIFIMRADGTHVRRLTSNGPDNLPAGHPSFSPDGTQIVFSQENAVGTQLMLVGVDGTGLRELLPGVAAGSPSWSPDGRHVAFGISRGTGATTAFDIATVRLSSGHVRFLTDEPSADVRVAFAPDYSPSGRRVVFSEADAAGCRLVTMSVTGHHKQTVPTGDGCYVNASWGPLPG